MHFFDLDPLVFTGGSAQSQKRTLLDAWVHSSCMCLIWTLLYSSEALHNSRSMVSRVHTSCMCVVWTMLHSSEALHKPRSILSLKPVFTVHEFFELDHLILIRKSAQFSWTPQFTVHAFVSFGLFYLNQKLYTVLEGYFLLKPVVTVCAFVRFGPSYFNQKP